MIPRRLAMTAAILLLSPTLVLADDPFAEGLPPPGARPEPDGKPRGYHQKHHGGLFRGTIPSIWSDLDKVYRRNMHNAFTYQPWKWRYGYPVGSGISSGCQAEGPFGITERCGLTPLHYRAEAPTVFARPASTPLGASWYGTGTPVVAPQSSAPVAPPPTPNR